MLPLTRSRNRARFFGIPFSPSTLFEGGTVAGAWYDPSDLSTMFTTDAGTTPVAMPGGGAAVSVGRILDKSGNGNHAIAFNNTTARPELRARVNLLTYSEEFQNADWGKFAVAITANAGVAPNGTTTADLLYPSSATSNASLYRGGFASISKTHSYAAKAAGKNFFCILKEGTSGGAAWFNLATGQIGTVDAAYTASMVSLGNGWYRCSVTSLSGFNQYTAVSAVDADNSVTPTVNGTDGVLIWGADLRPANIGANVPTYQRIADANTYDTNGFPLYLLFDGIDDSMYTPANLNLSGTDKVAVFAGVRKNSAALGFFAELSANTSSNNGAFYVVANNGTNDYGVSLRGTAQATYQPVTYTAPISNVLAVSYDIAGAAISDEIVPRVNGVVEQDNPSGANAGTGNFGTYPLFIGARNNASSFLNGHLYSLAVVGSAVSAGNIAAMESWVAGKTGIQI